MNNVCFQGKVQTETPVTSRKKNSGVDKDILLYLEVMLSRSWVVRLHIMYVNKVMFSFNICINRLGDTFNRRLAWNQNI